MPTENRSGVLSGETILLRVIVTDDSGNLRSTDSLPDVYIYDESVDADTIQTEIDAATYASALAGPLTPTLITTGFYELSYAVPPGSGEGDWHDVWVGAIDGVSVTSIELFKVTTGGVIDTQNLNINQMVVVELDATIGNVGATDTLGEDLVLAFATIYSPFYASPDLVRMEAGPWIDYVPDDTLALMIHWASLEADTIAPNAKCNKVYRQARTRFVIYDAALKALTLPGGVFASGLGTGSGDSKTLGELSIQKGDPVRNTLSGGVDLETINYFRNKRDEWWRVVNAGGCIVPGEGLGPEFAVKGRFDPDKRLTGRLWENPDFHFYEVPTANSRFLRGTRRRGRFGYHRHRPRHNVGYGHGHLTNNFGSHYHG